MQPCQPEQVCLINRSMEWQACYLLRSWAFQLLVISFSLSWAFQLLKISFSQSVSFFDNLLQKQCNFFFTTIALFTPCFLWSHQTSLCSSLVQQLISPAAAAAVNPSSVCKFWCPPPLFEKTLLFKYLFEQRLQLPSPILCKRRHVGKKKSEEICIFTKQRKGQLHTRQTMERVTRVGTHGELEVGRNFWKESGWHIGLQVCKFVDTSGWQTLRIGIWQTIW